MKDHSTGFCRLCQTYSPVISQIVGVCSACIKTNASGIDAELQAIHAGTRSAFALPSEPPEHPQGVTCTLCANQCRMGESEKGFCGLRVARNNRLVHLSGTSRNGMLKWYRDPLPANRVVDWVCEGHLHRDHHNLAVFYESCTMNCLYCQNWHYRESVPDKQAGVSAEELAAAADPSTFCVCFFGGDPSSQMMHALSASKRLAAKEIRICWETNGTMHPSFLEKAMDYSLQTGGCIKFDLKAWNDPLHRALTGISNKQVLKNFRIAAERSFRRPDPPLVVACTLLVPGYIDAE